jgi:hypothetical protein
MSAPRPDRDDLRDDVVDRAWGELMRETPSAALDDAIRAAARRAVGAKPRAEPRVAEAREPWRWWMPLAAAATIGAIAIGVLQNLPQDASEPTVVSDAATARRAPSLPASPAPGSPPSSETPAKAMAAPGFDALAPKTAADAAPSTPTPEQRDRVPLPLPRSDVARVRSPESLRQEGAKPDATVQAAGPIQREAAEPETRAQSAAPIVQDAAKPGVREQAPAPIRQEAGGAAAPSRSDAPAKSSEDAAPSLDDRLAARAPAPPVAALGKRADEAAPLERKNESDAASGFVASPPPAGAEGVIAGARQAPASAADVGASAPASLAPPDIVALAPAPASPARATAPAMVPPSSAPAASTAHSGAADVVAARATRSNAEKQGRAVSPDVFIAEIRRLLAAGDRDGAARELRRFRRTHVDADARLPVELREFAATVAR